MSLIVSIWWSNYTFLSMFFLFFYNIISVDNDVLSCSTVFVYIKIWLGIHLQKPTTPYIYVCFCRNVYSYIVINKSVYFYLFSQNWKHMYMNLCTTTMLPARPVEARTSQIILPNFSFCQALLSAVKHQHVWFICIFCLLLISVYM